MKTKVFVIALRVGVVILLFSMLTFCTSSCRTMKQTSTAKKEVKTSANLDVKKTVDNQSTVDSSQSVIDKSVTNSLISEDITVTQLSKPDSIGRQFTTQTTVIHRLIDNTKASDIKTETKVNTNKQNKTTLHDTSDYKSDDKSKLVTSKETKTPALVYPLGIVFILALIAGSYYLIKKYNVIAWIIGLWNKIKVK